MTVIAWDGRTLAADSLTTFGDERSLIPAEKIRIAHGRAYGAAGIAGIFDALIEWHHAGADAAAPPKGVDKEWSLLVIEQDLTGWHYCGEALHPMRIAAPWSIGSGGRFAAGAMLAGADAAQAVEIAIRMSTTCGPPVTKIDVAAALGAVAAAAE